MIRNFFNRFAKPNHIPGEGPSLFFPNTGIYVHPEAAMKIAAFNRGVVYLSTQVAKLPIDIKDSDNRKVKDRLHYIINVAPNPEMNAFKFWASMVSSALKHGNAYAEIERDGIGRVIALWPLDSDTVIPMRDEYKRFVFRVQTESRGQVDLLPRDIFHIPNLHMENGIGQGIVKWAQTTLGISMGADEMASSIFANGGFPSGVIHSKIRLTPEAATRLKNNWEKAHGRNSTGKRGGTAVLEEGLEYKAIEVDNQTLQFLESRQFGVVEIARFLNVHPHKLYDTSKSTYNNTEQANLEMITDTLDAWVTNIEAEIDVKLLNNQYGGKWSDFDLYQVARGDMKTRGTYFKDMMQTGAISPNEIREKENQPPYAGGEEYYIAVNNYTPASRVHDVIDSQIKKGTPPEKGDAEKEEEELTKALLRNLAKG